VRQVFWLISAAAGLRPQVARHQVRSIRLDHQPLEGDESHQFPQVLAPPFVADPAGDADREIEVEVIS